MKKLFAMFLALTMTFQLMTPVWADGAGEEPEKVTEASEVAEEAEPEEDVPEEETTEATEEEGPEETEVPTESEEVPTEETEPETTDAEETQPETVEETAGMLAEGVIDSGTCGDDLTWMLTQDGTLTISGTGEMAYYYGSDPAPWYKNRKDIVNVVVTSGVTSIGSLAFYSCRGLTSITIPDGVTSIGDLAFDSCSSLSSITIPDGVTRIGDWAFQGCRGLTSITIPDGVTSIGFAAFYDCSSLSSITIPDGVTSIEGATFKGCSSLTSVRIPDGVTSIEGGTFEGCSSLTSITIPEGVTSIEFMTFWGCSSLSSITIPESVTSIGDSAFSGCSSLTSVSIAKSVTNIGYGAFYGCNQLTDITFAHRGYDSLSIGDSAFCLSERGGEPVFTTVHVPTTKTMNQAIRDYDWTAKYYGYQIRDIAFEGSAQFPMTSIRLSTQDGADTYEQGVSVQLVATPDPLDSTDDIVFSIVAEKTTADAWITLKGALRTYSTGTVTIRAACVQQPEISDEITLTIVPPTGSLSSLTVTTMNDYPGEAEIGKPVQMVPVLTPANVAERTVTWSIENGSGTATIDRNGLLTPLTAGTVTVYATTPSGVEGSCTVNIQRYAESVTILVNGHTDVDQLGVGETVELSAILSPDDTTTKDVEWNVVYQTGSAELTIGNSYNPYSKLVGKQAGTVLLTATAKDSKQVVAQKVLTVTDSIRTYALPDGSGNLYYSTETGWITWSDSTVQNVLIPGKIDGVTIVGISPYAFANRDSWGYTEENKTLASVSIPASITEIGEHAFDYCTAMSTLRFAGGSRLKKIGNSAFQLCSGLTSVRIPESVTEIESSAFRDCYSLSSITIPEGVTSIEGLAFNACRSLSSVRIPEGVTSIGNWAFSGCSSLTGITIPEGVTSIGWYAFQGCSSLTSITIPKRVTSIGDSAFRGCSSLTSMRIPEGVTSIGNGVFSDCSGLTSITISESVTSIGWSAFSGCSSLTSMRIPEGVTSIESDAFRDCSSLTSMRIPEGVTSIENGTFSHCSSLSSITIPEGVTSIGWSAFSGCSSLTSITIPEGVTSMGDSAFSGCSSLTSITIPEGVTNIGEYAFRNCSSLSSITIPEGVTSIGVKAFSGCSCLTSVTIPVSVTRIDEDAFLSCFKLKDVYYGGTKSDWDSIENHDKDSLKTATIHYQIQSAPEIRPVDASTLDGGATLKLTLWSIDQNKQIGAAWSLAEGSEAYASITASGTLTAKAVIQPVEITVIAQPTNGEPTATKTIRITPKATALLLMRDGEVLGETLNADMYDLQALTLTAIKNTMEEAQGIHWSTSAKTVAQVDAKGLVTLLKPGTAVIQATDSGKLTGKVTLNVTYTDKSPRLEATTLNLNTALSGGVTVDFVEAYGNGVEALQWNDERFLFEYQENRLTVSAKDALKNGTYPVSLTAACSDGRTYTYPLTLKVTNTLPKVTVRQTAKLNLFYRDSRAPLVISAPGQSIENAELTDTGDFALENTEDGWKIVCATDSAKPDTKGTLNLYLEGYREPVKVALNIGTVSTAPRAKLSATSSTVNSGSDLTTQVRLLDNSGKPLELEAPTVVCENASVSVDGNLLTITLDEAKSTTVTLYLQDSTWAKSMKLTHKITVSNKTPTLKPAGSLTLSSLFTARTAGTAMVLSQSNLTLVDAEATPTAKAGTSALAESEKLSVAYDPETGHMVAAIRDPGNAPKAGTYSFTCTGTLEDGTQIPGGTLRVTVSAAAPKIKLSATSVKLNQYLAGEEQGRVRVTAPSGYQVADFTGKPEGMSFDGDTGMLTVTLEDASHRGGTYSLYPLVRDMETGEEVTLPTKLSFQVRAYNSNQLSVSLSAKGKLNTQTDGEIAYTVTKLTNCLGTVENVDLVGQDGGLFQTDMDLVNGRPTVHLTLVSGSTYATNKAYKIQLRFYACGKEILSPVQTVKVTQTALKVTAPKTVTYYQAQKAPLRVALTTNLPMDTVALNSKTAKEFQSALGEVTLNGNRVEFEIANPAALTAGKSYSVILDATPENNAKNGKPVTVKLTVKVRK